MRNITDLAADQRSALEQILGTRLSEHQQIVVQVLGDEDSENVPSSSHSISQYAILADLDDASLTSFDEAIRRSPSRDHPLP